MNMKPRRLDFGIASLLKEDVEFGESVEHFVSHLLRIEPPSVELPIQYSLSGSNGGEDGMGGPPVGDPLTVYVSLPFGRDACCSRVVYSASIAEMVDDVVESHCDTSHGRVVDVRGVEILKRLAASLREQAGRLDAAIG